MSALQNLRPLTQEERQNAYTAAQQAVARAIGERPQREQFNHYSSQRYPPFVTKLITWLCGLSLLAAFTPSAIRLYVIGSQTFGGAVPQPLAMVAVGVATVLTAEIGQVVFSLALATMGTTPSARRLLYASMGIATAIALVGNVQLAMPGHERSPFAWLEAVAPPLMVLSIAYVLKKQMLEVIELRHANERAYQEAVSEWSASSGQPEKHPQWNQFYANALRDAVRKANARRKDAIEAVTLAEWRALVHRELQADSWYQQPESIGEQLLSVPLALRTNGNGVHA